MNRLSMQVIPYLLLASLALTGCGGSKSSEEPKAAATSPAEAASLPSDVRDLAAVSDAAQAAEKAAEPTAGTEAGSGQPASAGAPGSAPAAGQVSPDGSTVAATGEFVSPVSSELAARFPGRVARVMADEGQRVRKGQPVFALETEYLALDLQRAEAELARARATAADAERDFNRKKDLIAKGSIAQAAYDRSQGASEQAAASVAGAAAARELARQRLADAVHRSPIDGVVAEKRTDVGERLGDNSVAFVILQTSPLKLRFHLAERYLGAVRAGQRVRAHVDPYPDRTFEGKVALVGGVVDPSTRTVMVETEFPNRDGKLSPGLFARVEIDLGARTAGGGAR